jgi:hypothetical protein
MLCASVSVTVSFEFFQDISSLSLSLFKILFGVSRLGHIDYHWDYCRLLIGSFCFDTMDLYKLFGQAARDLRRILTKAENRWRGKSCKDMVWSTAEQTWLGKS